MDWKLTRLALLMLFVALPGGPAANAQEIDYRHCPNCLLMGVDLSGRDLTDANLAGADLSLANLEGATLDGAILIGAKLIHANLKNASLVPSSRGPADLTDAVLAAADLTGAKLDGAILQHAVVTCATFDNTDLTATSFGPKLREPTGPGCTASFRGSRLGCSFREQWGELDLGGANTSACDGRPPATSLAEGTLPACVPSETTFSSVVYVAAGAGKDEAGCGKTVQGACATIAYGIGQCPARAGGCGVLVEYDVYHPATTIKLAAGASLYGGCSFTSNQPVAGTWYSAVNAPSSPQPGIFAAGINSETVFQGFQVLAGSPSNARGLASVAMMAARSPRLTLKEVKLIAGTGDPGAPGGKGAVGEKGGEGGHVTKDSAGGAGGTVGACSSTSGGRGAQNSPVTYYDCSKASYFQHTGDSGWDGTTGVYASGGHGAEGAAYCVPREWPGSAGNGENGQNAGFCGAGGKASADLAGSFQKNVWVAARGGAGASGGDGGGGGGGGSGGPCCYYCCIGDPTLKIGQAGGGGGAGGCGGAGGKGGQMGGASIALTLIGAAPRLDTVTLVAATGGTGGRGGVGEKGGAGGRGGDSYSVAHDKVCVDVGGAGGRGGDGGAGGASGGGAGGNGGPAFGLALVDGANPAQTAVLFYKGRAGTPGDGTAGGYPTVPNACKGGTGDNGNPGTVADTRKFEQGAAGPSAPEPVLRVVPITLPAPVGQH